MNQYTLSLKQFIAENKNDYERIDIYALNDLFGVYYRVHNPLDMDRLESECPDLAPIVQSLSQRRRRRLQRMIAEICDEYRQTVFLDGLRTGVRLLLELLEEESD